MPLHVLTPAGGAEKEPQRHDAGIECRGCHPGIRHVQLVGAQVIRCGGVRRSLQKPGEILDGSDMSLLGFVAHSANGVRRGANPANARPTDCLREVSVLGQESVPRMQGIGTRRPCECDHGGAVEQVKGGFGFMSADAGDAHTGCRAADARRNLAPIGNEQRPDAEGAERACASSRLTSDRVQRVTRDAPTAPHATSRQDTGCDPALDGPGVAIVVPLRPPR